MKVENDFFLREGKQQTMPSYLQILIEPLLGIPYRWWDPSVSCAGDHGPFWAFNGPLPSRKQIEEGKLNCAGFVNLICRTLGVPIPGADSNHWYAGGTGAWYDSLKEQGVLQPFLSSNVYPEGTLFIRQYKSEEDQGHLAISMGPNRIVHSWPEGGTCYATIQKDYYEWVCAPQVWMKVEQEVARESSTQ